MNLLNKKLVALIALSCICIGQLRSNLPIQSLSVNDQGLSNARSSSFINLNRFSMNHSFGMSMSTFGKQSISTSTYSNQMSYFIKDNLTLNTALSIALPTGGINRYTGNGLNRADLFYNTSLNYQPSENLFIKFSMKNYPNYRYNMPYNHFRR